MTGDSDGQGWVAHLAVVRLGRSGWPTSVQLRPLDWQFVGVALLLILELALDSGELSRLCTVVGWSEPSVLARMATARS